MSIWKLDPIRIGLRAAVAVLLFAAMYVAFNVHQVPAAEAQIETADLDVRLNTETAAGNDAPDFDFTLVDSTGTEVSTFVLSSATSSENFDLDPGTYTIRQTPVAGWKTFIECREDDTFLDVADVTEVTINLDAGLFIDCIFTNSDLNAASLTVRKYTDNFDTDPDFAFEITGPSPASFAIADRDRETFNGIPTGIYTITEAEGAYETNITCFDRARTIIAGGDNISFIELTLAGADSISCEFTNVDTSGSIEVSTRIDPSDNTDATLFQFEISGPGFGVPVPFSLDVDSSSGVPNSEFFGSLPVGSYTITETAQAGFTTYINCDDDTTGQRANVEPGNTVTIEVSRASEWDCEFSNRRDVSRLQIYNQVQPHSGTDSQQFDYTVTGDAFSESFTLDDLNADDTFPHNVDFQSIAPGPYTIAVTPVDGYVTAIECFDNSHNTGILGQVDGNSLTVDLPPGTWVSCDATHTAQAVGTLRVQTNSSVRNDPTDFTFTVVGENVVEEFMLDSDGSDPALPFQTTLELAPGAYTLTEDPVQGYLTSLSCNGSSGFEIQADGPTIAVDVAPGESVSCRATHRDSTMATVVIEKRVEPTTGDSHPGGIGDERFDFVISGGTIGFNQAFDLATNDLRTFVVEPGTYTVDELNVAPNFSTAIDCVRDPVGGPDISIAGTSVTFDLGGGDNMRCRFTNTNLANAIIYVDKQVRPGDADPTDFTFTMTGPVGFSETFVLDDDEFSTFVQASQAFENLQPGAYSITENAVAGYTTTIECFDNASIPTGERLERVDEVPIVTSYDGNSINFELAAGQGIACRFLNRVPDATLVVVKDDTGDTGTEFAVSVGQSESLIAEGTIADDGVAPTTMTVGVVAWDDIQVVEVIPSTFTADMASTRCVNQLGVDVGEPTFAGDIKDVGLGEGQGPVPGAIEIDDDNVRPGDTITCTMVNIPMPGSIQIEKVTPDGADPTGFVFSATGGLTPATFTLDTDPGTTNSDTQMFLDVPVGTYTVTEAAIDGYAARVACTEDPGNQNSEGSGNTATINLGPGEVVSCTFVKIPVFYCDGAIVTINMNTNGGNGLGTAGDDVILGTPGNDVIMGLGGDDILCGEGGDDMIRGGDGNDRLRGDDGNDKLFGEAGRDIARGGPGVDEVSGGDGDDRLLGGIGDDTLNGGEGDDYIGGFGGADTISGGPGDETIFGGFGADIINGGPGNDTVFGLIGDDTITGGPGNDTLNGDRGNDRIDGGSGDDIIAGGNANDILRGNAGDDIVSGGKADDTLSGNGGTDVCIGNLQNIADTADATCESIFGVP